MIADAPNTKPFDPKQAIEDANEKIDAAQSAFQTEGGKQYWLNQGNALKKEFSEYAIGMASHQAFNAVGNNLKQTQGNLAASLDQDPSDSALNSALNSWGNSVKALVSASPTLGGELAGRASELGDQGKRELVDHAMQKRAENDPAGFLKSWNSGAMDQWKQYLTPETQTQLPKFADSQAKTQMVLRDKQNEEAVNAALTKNFNDNLKMVGGQLIPTKDFLPGILDAAKLPGAKPSEINAAIGAHRAIVEDQASGRLTISDGATYKDLSTRAFLPQGDETRTTAEEINQARVNHSLNNEDYKVLMDAINSKDTAKAQSMTQFNDYIKTYEKYVTKSNMFQNDPAGDARAYELRKFAQQRFDAGIATGKSPDELLAPPGSKGSILSPQDIQRFQVTTKQGIQDLTDKATGVITPLAPVMPEQAYKPGKESIADYARRLQAGGKTAPAQPPGPSPADLSKLKKAMTNGQ